jgi:hypothetical protein
MAVPSCIVLNSSPQLQLKRQPTAEQSDHPHNVSGRRCILGGCRLDINRSSNSSLSSPPFLHSSSSSTFSNSRAVFQFSTAWPIPMILGHLDSRSMIRMPGRLANVIHTTGENAPTVGGPISLTVEGISITPMTREEMGPNAHHILDLEVHHLHHLKTSTSSAEVGLQLLLLRTKESRCRKSTLLFLQANFRMMECGCEELSIRSQSSWRSKTGSEDMFCCQKHPKVFGRRRSHHFRAVCERRLSHHH